MKPIYKPEALYKADINDLVEEDIAKGGVGSGIRGHRTAEKPSDPHSKQKIEMFESSLKAKKQVHAKFKKEKPGYKPGNPNHDMTEASIQKMTSKLKEMRGGKPKAAPKTETKPKKAGKTIKDLLPILKDMEDKGAGFFNRNSDGSMTIFVRGAHGNDPNQWHNARAIQNAIGYQAEEIKPDPQSGHLVIRVRNVYSTEPQN